MGRKKLRGVEVKKACNALWRACNKATMRLQSRVDAEVKKCRTAVKALQARCLHDRLKRLPLCYIGPKDRVTRQGYDCQGCRQRLWLTTAEHARHVQKVKKVL